MDRALRQSARPGGGPAPPVMKLDRVALGCPALASTRGGVRGGSPFAHPDPCWGLAENRPKSMRG
jgi:hypothetical protein